MGTMAAPQPRPHPHSPLRPDAEARTRVAFVCVGNSCRSQMAEAWARHLGADAIEAVSAGLHPLGLIPPETLQVMQEKNVSLAGQESKGLEAIDWKQVEVLVNMTPLPGRSVVPGFEGRRLEWRVRDPYGQPLRIHRKVRDELERKVRELLAELLDTFGAPPAPPVA